MTYSRRMRHPDPRQLELFDHSDLPEPVSGNLLDHLRQRPRSDESTSMQGKTRERKPKRASRVVQAGVQFSGLNISERLVCVALLELSRSQSHDTDGDGGPITVTVGYRALSARARVSERTLARALKRLETEHLIKQQFPQSISGRSTKSYQLFFQDHGANIVAAEKLSPLTTDDTTPSERKTSAKRKTSMRTAPPRKKGNRSA